MTVTRIGHMYRRTKTLELITGEDFETISTAIKQKSAILSTVPNMPKPWTHYVDLDGVRYLAIIGE